MISEQEYNLRRRALIAQINNAIARDGWAIQGVFATTSDEISFAYTVGMTGKKLPELLMSGLPLEYMHRWLNHLGEQHAEKPFQVGVPVEGFAEGTRDSDISFQIIEALTAPVGFANEIYGPDVAVLQVVWPDDEGRYPTDPKYNKRFRQKLFGLDLSTP